MRSTMVSSAWMLLAAAVMVTIMLTITGVAAHNWIGSPSRAKQAAVTKPCQMRVDNQPHIQVGPLQEFQMEWTMGHGDTNTKNFYWVALHSDDYDQLLTATTQMFDDYIKHAPQSAYQYESQKWKKVHLAPKSASGVAVDPATRFGAMYGSQVPINASTDPYYIPRDSVMSMRKNVFPNNQFYEFRFFDNSTANDVRVSYTNANYSWIESVHRFHNSFFEHNPYAGQFDMATFDLPARKGPGEYIYFFYWGGYRDCVDIDVRSTAVTNRYGIYNATASTSFVKIEHCQFYYLYDNTTPCNRVNATTLSAQTCLTQCQKGYCTGVQAVRAVNPTSTLSYTVGIPQYKWNDSQWDQTVFPHAVTGPCGSPDLHTRNTMGCRVPQPTCNLATIAPGPEDYICYGLVPYRDQDFQAIDDYIITDDAADPRFYSTCWIKVANTGFLDVQAPAPQLPPWDAGDSCVDCAFARAVRDAPIDRVSHWAKGMSSSCVNCDAPTI